MYAHGICSMTHVVWLGWQALGLRVGELPVPGNRSGVRILTWIKTFMGRGAEPRAQD